jgi:phosphate/sulfate permease
LGGIGIAIGLIIYGEKVMIIIGKNILILDYLKGFVA